MMYRILCLACLLFLSTSPASGQPGEWFVYDHTNTPIPEDVYIKAIEVDNLGRVWAQNGELYVYSNDAWQVFSRTDLPLWNGWVNEIAVDARGILWTGCWYEPYGCGIFPIDASGPTIQIGERDLVGLNILDIAADSEGRVWASRQEARLGHPEGLALYEDSTWTVVWVPDFNAEEDWDASLLYHLAVDSADTLWGAAWNGCHPDEVPCSTFDLRRFDGENWTILADLPVPERSDWVSDLALDASNGAWVAMWYGGLFRYVDGALSNITMANSPLPSDSINALHVKGNALWIGTKGGLVKREGDAWTVYDTTNSGLPANNVTAIATDTYGNMWVATYSASDPPDGSSQLAVFQEGGVVLDAEDPSLPASTHRLLPNHPNPFSETTTLSFELTTPADVRLRVFDLLGREVATPVRSFLSEGRHTAQLKATGLSNGVYLVRLEANGRVDTQRIIVLH
ncbi:MAG: T9SS type A sorting domain-containing protein [Bacteroidetes bacterium]|nr:T9SS type A sorting domain-containing protein [Bacteroidota bacterium]